MGTAVTLAQELEPDVVVMDVSMPELNGPKATEKLKECCPEIKVLTLTRHRDDSYLQQLLQAGASGYVLKKSAPDDLVRAIRAVVAGKTSGATCAASLTRSFASVLTPSPYCCDDFASLACSVGDAG
jgi:DNA-binding NarL/FixJ family response regulator